MKSSTTKWNELFADSIIVDVYVQFANGNMSRRQMESVFKNTDYAGPFRALVRNGGVDRAREVAKKALKRRSLI